MKTLGQLKCVRNSHFDRKRIAEEREAIIQALREDGPFSRREIQMEINLSQTMALERLDDLKEEGLITQQPSQDDGRIPVYSMEEDHD